MPDDLLTRSSQPFLLSRLRVDSGSSDFVSDPVPNMELVETHALSSFDHNSKPTVSFSPPAAIPTSRSPDVAGDRFRQPDIGDTMGIALSSDSASPTNGGLQSDVVKDIAVQDGEKCTSDTAAAMTVQKAYRGYRTRRMLADSAVVAEELWWQVLDYARLNHSTVSFFNYKPESAASRWHRIRVNAAKVGKGLSKDAKAQKLAFQHWIEAIDPRHRYGHSLHLYYEEWCKSDAGQPFFYWLDLGDGREVDLKECPRSKLRQQCIKYLGPQEREQYEYVIIDGKFLHKQTGESLDTPKDAKWIFVMSTSKRLYAGEKKKGVFHHSSFLAGGATLAAGRLVVVDGTLKTISAYSGHYRPTDEILDSFLQFLKDNGVNLDTVEIRRGKEGYEDYDEGNSTKDAPTSKTTKNPDPAQAKPDEERKGASLEPIEVPVYQRTLSGGLQTPKAEIPATAILQRINSKKAASSYQLGHQLSRKWSTGAGPRIGCVADYPVELRLQALELTHLSPRPSASSILSPSPRPASFSSPIKLPSQLTNNDVKV